MAACPKGFASCRFKTYVPNPEWSPVCVRCGRVNTDAARRGVRIDAASRCVEPVGVWPFGSNFKFWSNHDRMWSVGWKVGQRTKCRQFFWKPEHDGFNPRARRMSLREWNRQIADGEIRFVS